MMGTYGRGNVAMVKILIWLRAIRAPILVAGLIPVLVGSALAAREGNFQIIALIYALIIVMSGQAGANLLNDYVDAEGSDRINTNYTPFNGGSRLIQDGILKRSASLRMALVAFVISLGTSGFVSFFYSNWLISLLGVIGVLLAIGYSSTFICGMAKGWGELMVGVAFGPLSVIGSYLLQTGTVDREAFLAGIPVAFFIMGVLILNQFPDITADALSGKRNWIVMLGIQKGVWVYLVIIALAYLTLLGGVLTGIFPKTVLYSYMTIPLAVWVGLKLWRYRERVPELIPALAGNIGLHAIAGILITLGFLL